MAALIQAKGTALFSSAKIVLYFFLFVGHLPLASAQEYTGYRLSIGNISITEATQKHLTIKCNLVNTGREPISILKDKPLPTSLLIEIDQSKLATETKPMMLAIKQQLNREKLQLSPGQIIQNVTFKVPKDVVATQDETSSGNNPPHFVEVDYTKECPDLVFDSVFIISKSKKSAVLGFIIRNVGGTSAQLYGQSNKKEDNLAVNVYFVRTERISKGTMLANGIFIPETKDNKAGMLPPGKQFAFEIEVNIEDQTKFTPNYAFELDPFQTVFECDKTNNVKVLKMSEE